jgi:hypothetical protein
VFRKFFELLGHAGRPQRRSSAAPKTQGRCRLQVEQLESRLVPSYTISILGGVLTVICTGGPDTITVSHSGLFTVINGSTFTDASYLSIDIYGANGGLTANIQANVKPVRVVDSSLSDVVNVGNAGSLSGIQSPVSILTPSHFTTLNVDDSADGANHNAVFVSAGSITGLAQAPISYQQTGPETGLRALNISTGTGQNYVFVTSTPSSVVHPHTALIGHSETTYIYVGQTGSVSGIQGALDITNPPHHTNLSLQDWADGASHTNVVVTASSVTGLAPATISYQQLDLGTLEIRTGTAINIVNVQSTPVSSSPSNDTLLEGGSVTTTVNVGNAGSLSGILGALTVSHASFLNVDDSADALAHANVVVTADANGAITGLAPATIGYYQDTRAVNIAMGTGTNTVNVQGTFANQPLTINAQPVVNNLTVNIGTLTHNLDTIQGNVTVNGSLGQTTLNILDQNEAANVTWTLTPGSVTRTGSALISYAANSMAMDGVNISGGSGTNTYNIRTAARWLTTLNTGTGNDAINVLAINHTVVGGGSLVVNDQGTGTVTMGNAGSLSGIQGAVAVSNASNYTTLVVDDSADGATHANVVVTAGSITGLAPATISYQQSGLRALAIATGTGTNTVNVSSTPFNAVQFPHTALIGHSASTTVNVGNSTDGVQDITGALDVSDPGNLATLVVDDSADAVGRTVTLGASGLIGTIAGLAPANITYLTTDVGWLVVNGGSGGNVFNVEGLSSGSTTIHAGTGGPGDIFRITPTSQSLADIAGALTLNGSGSGLDILEFFDQNNPNAETYTFDSVPSNLTLASVPVSINFSGFAGNSVYLETNGLSTVNDASGLVNVDVPPP